MRGDTRISPSVRYSSRASSIASLALLAAPAGDDQQPVAEARGVLLDAARDLGEERVVEVVEQHPHRVGAVAGQAAGDRVRAVAEARGRLQHELAPAVGHLVAAAHDQGHQRARHAGLLRHVVHRHVGAPAVGGARSATRGPSPPRALSHRASMALERFKITSCVGALQSLACRWSAPNGRVRGGEERVRGPIEPGLAGRLAAGPISWGVCEVPGWGLQLTPDRVFSEMAELGITATELGPLGWLPLDGREAKAVLDRYGLRWSAGSCPVVVHEPRPRPRRASRRAPPPSSWRPRAARSSSPRPCRTWRWSAPAPLDRRRLEARGRAPARARRPRGRSEGSSSSLHPHVGTLLETADDVGSRSRTRTSPGASTPATC